MLKIRSALMIGSNAARPASSVTSDTTTGSAPLAGQPRRVSLDGPPITVRQFAPRLEAHHAVGIEQPQDRGPLDTKTSLERIECHLVDILEPVDAIDRVCR